MAYIIFDTAARDTCEIFEESFATYSDERLSRRR